MKRKKERKKIRQKTNAVVAGDGPPSFPKDNEEDEWEDEEANESMVAEAPMKPPKKKRKLRLDDPIDPACMDVDVDPVKRKSPTPSLVGALPSFPLPRHPDAPSKTDLALQGLDKSIADAEIIWDGETQDLDNLGSRLSSRMQKRLKELGIVELFAGWFCILFPISFLTAFIVQKVLLPILLPSETSIYTPYNPSSDVCVSAPTGSGKTLAYAIPIVEVVTVSFHLWPLLNLSRLDTLSAHRDLPASTYRRSY